MGDDIVLNTGSGGVVYATTGPWQPIGLPDDKVLVVGDLVKILSPKWYNYEDNEDAGIFHVKIIYMKETEYPGIRNGMVALESINTGKNIIGDMEDFEKIM
jgi:hypothetical protein